MHKFLHNHRSFTIFFIDLGMVILAWITTFYLYYDFKPPVFFLFSMLPYVLLIQGVVFYYCGLCRGVWRFASISDLIRIIKAVLISVISITLFCYWRQILEASYSLLIVYSMLLFLSLSGPRLLYRCLKDYQQSLHTCNRVLIIGAGSAGESLVRDLKRFRARGYQPVAFVDDDIKKLGQEIHGIRVVGTCQAIPRLTTVLNIQLNLIAIPSATQDEMQRIISYCNETSVPFCELPSLQEIAKGKLHFKTYPDISLARLLGREEISLSENNVADLIMGKVILVSGGGGSIGSELCMQLAAYPIKQLIILDHSEFNLYSIDLKLRNTFPELVLHCLLCNITDKETVNQIFSKYRPDVVFHAAAYKHVPLLESQIRMAVYNNIIGSRVLAEASALNHCHVFVLISTDKAVNPTNIMGATKRAAEIFCQNYNDHTETRFMTVRFGNVLDSAGSVVPLFIKQLMAGGPLTVTHPEITRFFMTIPEASQLIIQAADLGEGGEIFVLDMGEPINISYLAGKIIQLSGKVLGKDIHIKYTGLRPGEKLHEELFYSEEELQPTRHAKIVKAQSKKRTWSLLIKLYNELELACEANNEEKLLQLLCLLVPEYQLTKEETSFPYPQVSYS